jgi:3-oxoadipate enol-lactonase
MKLRPPHSTIVDVTERDSAPWITMVHAATHHQRFFSSQVQTFQSDYRLLLIDLPGHGKSASLPGPYGFEEYAVSVLAAMDAAGVDQTHYLGSHTGAAVALILACRYGRRFRSLALESAPIPGLDLPSVTENYARARATARRSGIEVARAEWLARGPWFAIIRKHPERCRADAHRAMVSEFSARPWLDATPAQQVAPVLDRLDSIHCPVLIINGEHDVDDFLLAAGELERRLPRVQRVIVPGAGGFPMWEDPTRVNDHIRRHLQDACMKS